MAASSSEPQTIWIGIRTDNLPGNGTLQDPFNGSGPRFDEKMQEFSWVRNLPNLRVQLLPGTYETRGQVAWYARDGWKIHGAGMELTTVKLVGASNNVFSVIGNPHYFPTRGVEVADLTVDCNYGPNNLNTTYAVALAGTQHAIRRVKAINSYGKWPGQENFILSIGTGGLVSDGNVIEDCEVTNFKGTYATAIGFVGAPESTATISGIIRGNRIHDLKSADGISVGYAIGGGNLRNVIVENNYAFRCTTGFYVDTGKSVNVTLRNNQFLQCINGFGIYGNEVDNFMVENNFVEITAQSGGWGVATQDHGGFNKIRNFKIINNTVRAANNFASSFGGFAVVVLDGSSFHIEGNRIDAKLRSDLRLSGAHLFNNTDFAGNPLNLTEGSTATAIQLPRGQAGTLLLNRGSSYVICETTTDPAQNGLNLIAAYRRAALLRPHGRPLAADNRATLLLLPGIYSLNDGALVLDTPWVDLCGAAGAQSIRLESPGNTVVQVADDVVLENLTLHSSSIQARANNANDKAAFFPADNLGRAVLRNCVLSASGQALCMRTHIAYAGRYERCRSGAQSWGGPGNFVGVALDCQAGPASFGSSGWFTGAATNCVAGEGSFGGATVTTGGFHGAAKNCTAGHGSFGGSGIMVGCEVTGSINLAMPTTGKLTDCRVGPPPGNEPAIVLGNNAVLYNCTLLAKPTGTGYSIDAFTPVTAKIVHCRLNHGMHNVMNAIAAPGNVDDPALE